MSALTIDASELSELGRRMALAQAVVRPKLAATVKKAAQNVKEAITYDVMTSRNQPMTYIGIGYETGHDATGEFADVSPRDGGASSLANIAFFGTARGGGTHEFYGHAEDELPTLADYVADAAGDALEVLLWGA